METVYKDLNKYRYLLSIGASVGDRADNIKRALSQLEDSGCQIESVSAFFENPGILKAKNMFINICAVIETIASPYEALELFQNIENALGRVRLVPKGDRTIDIDIFLAEKIKPCGSTENLQLNEQNLSIPHLEGHKRNFVLIPANEIAPEWLHPIRKKTVAELCRAKLNL